MNPTTANTKFMCRKHKVSHYNATIIHAIYPILFCKDNQHCRRTIEWVKAVFPTTNFTIHS